MSELPKCSPGPVPNLTDLKKMRENVFNLLKKVDSDIATTNSRSANTLSESAFTSFSKQVADNVGAVSNIDKVFLIGENGQPIIPKNVTYEVDTNALYGFGWKNVRPPGMHPDARYASKKGESIRMINELAPAIVTLEEKEKEIFIMFVNKIQANESLNIIGQPAVINQGFDIRPREGVVYDDTKFVNKDLGPFPRTQPKVTSQPITKGYRERDNYRGDYGCWQYIPTTWYDLMKRYEPVLLAQNPQYRWCWLAPVKLEVELQLKSMVDAWKGCPAGTPYVIKATMLYMYNFLPVTYEKLRDAIAMSNPDDGWNAYLTYAETKITQDKEKNVSLSPLNGLGYLKSIATSYKKMKSIKELATLETYSVPKDPLPMFRKYMPKGN